MDTLIAAIVLAAGLSRRMGRAKALLDLGGVPLIRATVDRVQAGGVDEVLVVAGGEHEAVSRALAGSGVRLVVNLTPETGQAGSIATGVRALGPGVEAAVIALGDQPLLPASVILGLVAAYRRGAGLIVAPRYRDGRGTPVLFSAVTFPELLGLVGDRGARSVVERDPARLAEVSFDFLAPRDVDTPEDYERLRDNLPGV